METKCGSKAVDAGLLILRIGIGAAFIIHGYPKLMQSTIEDWAGLGANMTMFGITFAPAFWGFMAAFSEAVGGLLLLLGIFVRPAALLMMITMIVATTMLIKSGAEYNQYSHPLKLGIVFLSILISGGGKYALGCCLPGIRNSCCR